MAGRSKEQDTSNIAELVPQREPMHRGDNPEGRFRGVPPRSGRADERSGTAHAFSPVERALINAFLSLRDYPDARTADEPHDSSREVLLSDPADGRPTIVIAKENDLYSYALFEQRGVEEGVMSSGHENVDSLPLILAMIDRPDRF
jgi:hypothetical protein